MKTTGRITLSLDNKLMADLRRKAVELNVSLSAVAAGYIERGLYDDHVARSGDRIDELTALLQRQLENGVPAGDPVTPDEQRAFFLEVLLYFRALFKNEVGVRGDIANQVKKIYGDNRVKGI
jgi:hypothetical protein